MRLIFSIKYRVLSFVRRFLKINQRIIFRLNNFLLSFLPHKYRIKIYNFQKKVGPRKLKFAFIFTITFIILIVFIRVFTEFNSPKTNKITNFPYQEKVADGVWTLKNREPVHQVLSDGSKADLNLKELRIKNQELKKDEEKFRWSVTISSGTKFEFGGVSADSPKDKVLPIVKITNKEGYFVMYSPKSEALSTKSLPRRQAGETNTKYEIQNTKYVTPKVKGNIIEWEISEGITARYTMMQDRVKADYVINNKSNLISNKLEFDVVSGQINPKSSLKGELMPGGDIEWFSELVDSGGQTATQFTFPAPVVTDSKSEALSTKSLPRRQAGETNTKYEIQNTKYQIDSEYEFEKVKDGVYSLAVVLDEKDLEKASWPLTIDPVVIDAGASAVGTAYGNGRKILRDAWGNLIALVDGGTGNDNVYTKDYNDTTWVDEAIDIDGGAGSSLEIAADLDSSNNIHVVYRDTTLADIVYVKITVTRAGNNTITSVAKGTSVSLDITGVEAVRPSLIVANKGGGVGVEKVAVAYAMNATGGTIRNEVRFMQRDVAKPNYKDTILATSGLSGYWRLGESSGTNANDESTTANDGTYRNTPTLGVTGAIEEDSDTGVTFASNQDITALDNDAYDFGTGNFSLEVWVNRAAPPASNSEWILGHGGGGGATDWELYWRLTVDGFQSRISGATACNSGTGADITDSKWHHVVVTMNRTGLCTWYIDGEVSGTPTDISGGSAANLTNTSLLYIANRNPSLYYNGSLDEVAIYKGVVLTADQVQQHYDAATYAWRNASEEISGVGACSNTATSGAAGLPTTTICKGTTDALFPITAGFTTHQGVLTQIPGKPKRSPASVKKDMNGTFTTLSNTIDNNTGTTDDVNNLGTNVDYLYVGDDKPFSKVTFDITNTNANVQTFSANEYWNGASWVSTANTRDYTVVGVAGSTDRSFAQDGAYIFDEPSNWTTTTVDGVSGKYWIRLVPSGAFDATVSIAEAYVNDRNSKALMVVGGVDSTNDLGASYVVWDEINNDRWQNVGSTGNTTGNVGAPWISGITALSTTGFESTTFTNFVLSASVDYINNHVYSGYMEGTAVGSSNLTLKTVANNKDPTVAANWTDTALPAMTEAADSVVSLTADGSDIYMFYVLDPGTNSLVFRRCTGSGGGLGGICDNASDWGSEKTLDNGTDNTHPQAVVTKVTGDTVAIDTIFTTTTTPAVEYERHYVDLMDKTVVVAASADDAFHRDCVTGTDDQDITAITLKLGREAADASCVGSVDSENHIGLRFPNITVAQGAAISSAYIDLRVTIRTGSTPVDFSVYGQDVDNAVNAGAGFGVLTDCTDPCTNAVNTVTKTTSTSSQSINFVTNTYRIDVTDIVQEIVCRGAANSQPCVGDFNGSGTWASGNALAILMISTEGGASGNSVAFVSQDDTSTTMLDPTLQINVAPTGTTGKNYSLGSATQLATGSASIAVADLDHPLSSTEFGAVATNDTNYASISAVTVNASSSAQPAFMFKVNNSNINNNNNLFWIDASVVVKSTVATSTKPVYLQVYRGGVTDNWVTMATNNNTAADTEFTLTSPTISTNNSEYYFNETPGIGTRYAECTTATANCWTYWRVYQEAPTTSLNEVLSIDYVSVIFTGPDKVAFSNPARSFLQGCNGTANVFTMEIQAGTTPFNPFSTTVVRVTSDSNNYTIYSDNTCSTQVTNGDFTYTTSENTKSVYIRDLGTNVGTKTLTGTRQSGDVLTTGTQNYTLMTPSTRIKGSPRIRGGTRIN